MSEMIKSRRVGPHPATVQRQVAPAPSAKGRGPHPATVQRQVAPAPSAKATAPHPATIQRRSAAIAPLAVNAPHPATVQRKGASPHPAAPQGKEPLPGGPGSKAVQRSEKELEIVPLLDVSSDIIVVDEKGRDEKSRDEDRKEDRIDEKEVDFHITLQVMGELEEMCDEILKRYPPAKFFYLGLGRSPAPIIAYLQELAREKPNLGIRTANLPLGGIKGIGSDHVQLRSFSSDEKKALFAFFDDYLDTGMYGPRTILLMDFVESGSGLKVAEKLLNKFAGNPGSFTFLTGNMDIDVKTLAIYPKSKYKGSKVQLDKMEKLYSKLGFDTIDIPGDFFDDGSLASLLPSEKFKPFAEYMSKTRKDGKFTLDDAAKGEQPARNRLYDRLRRAIRRLI